VTFSPVWKTLQQMLNSILVAIPSVVVALVVFIVFFVVAKGTDSRSDFQRAGGLKEPAPDALVVGLTANALRVRARWWIEPPRRAEF
jgi:ABC-type phosphate transport system permease subunit